MAVLTHSLETDKIGGIVGLDPVEEGLGQSAGIMQGKGSGVR